MIDPPHLEVHEQQAAVTLFLLLHAFANGTTALTGVEAISNGIPAFKEPRSRNAGITLIWMACLLGALFLGISYLAGPIGAIPSEAETVISQLARTAFDGRGCPTWPPSRPPRSSSSWPPTPPTPTSRASPPCRRRTGSCRGSSPIAAAGWCTRAGSSCWPSSPASLIAIFNASVSQLIPLYAIGVFLSFTLSQAGMTRRWWKIGHLAPGRRSTSGGRFCATTGGGASRW